ncbi:MAG: hypothetical protein K2O07_04000, partial [Alistipes sp.]|nr:hypothetical protein [Alistipes sp.]
MASDKARKQNAAFQGKQTKNHKPHFSSKGVSSGADMKLVRIGCTNPYCLFAPMIEVTLMMPFHEKNKKVTKIAYLCAYHINPSHMD